MRPTSSAPSIIAVTLLALLGLILLPSPQRPKMPGTASPTHAYIPPIEPASAEAIGAIGSIHMDDGLSASLIASEPLMANPVAFWIDRKGRFYVAETYRQSEFGVPDNRDHVYWQDDDISCMSVEDRREMYLRHHPEYATQWTEHHDLIRLLTDTDGDGVLDQSHVFADGFNNLLDGTGAGLISRGNKVWYTCIPHLWLLEDTNNDGVADQRESLQDGFGVRVALRGHDMHGLCFGPDGRLYFSIGDRGYNSTTREGKHLFDPGSGAVFRCWPDGSELEVFATGLRNPQELAFDNRGNLFTGDNNSDSDDKARFVYVVEGANIGWRMNFQYLPRRGPWVREGWWRPRHKKQATFLIPCIANIGNGPSGLTHYPGIGLPSKYDDSFFMCDFLGSTKHSGVRNISLDPEGAGFRLREQHWFIKGVLATDTDFGPDGRIYTSDWVDGWVGPGKGRIQAYSHESFGKDKQRAAKEQLSVEFSHLDDQELRVLLGNADQRVRQEAQFALADRGATGQSVFSIMLRQKGPILPKLHAIWGLGQIARRSATATNALLAALRDADAEIRAQSARTLGDLRHHAAESEFLRLLNDPSPRTRFFAAIALGRLKSTRAHDAIVTLLETNADGDVYIRHGCVMALTGEGNADRLLSLANHKSRSVRLGALLALRRLMDPRVVRFFRDPDTEIAIEAVRAAYDTFMKSARPAVAALLGDNRLAAASVQRRAIAARDLLGRDEDIRALVAFASNPSHEIDLRKEALHTLASWANPGIGDRYLNTHAPREGRSTDFLRQELKGQMSTLLDAESTDTHLLALRLASDLKITSCVPSVIAVMESTRALGRARANAMRALHTLNAPSLPRHVRRALKSDSPRLRGAATDVLASLDPQEALPILAANLEGAPVSEHQSSLTTLGRMQHPDADELLLKELQKMAEGKLPRAVELELLAAADKRAGDGISRLRRVDWVSVSETTDDPVQTHRECLEGGDAQRGAKIFEENNAVSCKRCHALKPDRAELSGPPLMDVGTRLSRGEILSSIVLPNREIAEGFASVNVFTRNDDLFTGRIVSESTESLTMIIDDGEKSTTKVIPRSKIDQVTKGLSAMPTDVGEKLSRSQIRDLVEFLSLQQGR